MKSKTRLVAGTFCAAVALAGCAGPSAPFDPRVGDSSLTGRGWTKSPTTGMWQSDGGANYDAGKSVNDTKSGDPAGGPPETLVSMGSGKFVKDSVPGHKAQVQTGPDGEVTLNYVNADVREVLRDVLGNIMHVSYTVDPKVQGTVTVNTGKPLKQDAVLPVLEAVLRTNGLTVSQAENVYRIMPLDDSARGSPVIFSPGALKPGYGIRIVPLQFTSAGQLQKVLEPYAPPGGKIEADGARNVLIMSGTRQDLDGLSDLVQLFDVNWMASMSYAIYPLKVGTPRAISTELDGIFADTAQGPLAGLVRIIPLDRLNSILVISSQPAYLNEARNWIERLDYGDDETTPQIFHYYVQNSRASDLADVMSNLLSGSDVRTVKPQTAPGTTETEIGSGSSGTGGIGSGTSSIGSSSIGSNSGLTTQTSSIGSSLNGSLPPPPLTTASAGSSGASPGQSNASSASRLSTLSSLSAPRKSLFGQQGQEDDGPHARIVADDKNNALVIAAKPRDFRKIVKVLDKLDIVPLQVLIEATIAEVTLNDNLHFGLQYFLKQGNKQLTLTSGTTLGALAPALPGFGFILGGTSAQAVLSALSTVSDVNVISSPQLLVLDHQTAALQVGDQVPIITQQAVSTISTGAPIVNSVDFRDTGVILKVTPRVNSSGLVALNISQEVSDVVATTTSAIDSPTIEQRKFQSSVVVQDGETIALGGLIRDNTTRTENGIPILSRIPVAGALFRDTQRNKTRTELLVLLSTRVIRNIKEAQDMTDELFNKMQAVRPILRAPTR